MSKEESIRRAIRALYIFEAQGYSFKKILNESQFVFTDAQTSLDFMEFLNTYLVSNGKS